MTRAISAEHERDELLNKFRELAAAHKNSTATEKRLKMELNIMRNQLSSVEQEKVAITQKQESEIAELKRKLGNNLT